MSGCQLAVISISPQNPIINGQKAVQLQATMASKVKEEKRKLMIVNATSLNRNSFIMW